MRDHRFGKIATVIALAGVTLLAGSTVAQAGPAAPASGCFYHDPPVPAAGAIENAGNVGLGVVHLADGTCKYGVYDIILPKGQDTFHNLGWNEVTAAYIGPGFRVGWIQKGINRAHVSTGPCYVNAFPGGNFVVAAVPLSSSLNFPTKPVTADIAADSPHICADESP